MSAALQYEETARERLLENVLDQLEPLYATMYDGDLEIARQAAEDAMDPYVQDERADLAIAGQIIACGVAAMRALQLCMKPDIDAAELARLTRTADTLNRIEQRHRKTGLYPASPKPTPAPVLHTPALAAPEAVRDPAAEPRQPEATPNAAPSPTLSPPALPLRPGLSQPPAQDREASASLTTNDRRQIPLQDGPGISASPSANAPRA
jgi:hypothetical protein